MTEAEGYPEEDLREIIAASNELIIMVMNLENCDRSQAIEIIRQSKLVNYVSMLGPSETDTIH